MKCKWLDGGPSMLEYVPAVGEQKKGVVVERHLKPQAEGTRDEDEKKHHDPVGFIPFPVL